MPNPFGVAGTAYGQIWQFWAKKAIKYCPWRPPRFKKSPSTFHSPNLAHRHQIESSWTVCDETQNLNETESFFPIPNIFDTESNTFFDTNFFPIAIIFSIQHFTKPKPILFSIPNFFKTDTDTFFWNQNFSNWNRYLFYTKNFGNRFWYHRNNWKSFETEKFRKQNVTLWY